MTYRLNIPICCKYLSKKYTYMTFYLESPRFPSKEAIIRKLTKKLNIGHFGLVKEEVLDAVESIKVCEWPSFGKEDRRHHSCSIMRKEFGRQKLTIDEILVHNINDSSGTFKK